MMEAFESIGPRESWRIAHGAMVNEDDESALKATLQSGRFRNAGIQLRQSESGGTCPLA